MKTLNELKTCIGEVAVASLIEKVPFLGEFQPDQCFTEETESFEILLVDTMPENIEYDYVFDFDTYTYAWSSFNQNLVYITKRANNVN